MYRPMKELPECANCGQEISGGKGDWWHIVQSGCRRRYDALCADGVNFATPKQVPAPLEPIIEATRRQAVALKAQLTAVEEHLVELIMMRDEERDADPSS